MPVSSPVLPAQVSPPAFALSARAPHDLSGVDAIAYPIRVEDGRLLPGPGAAAGAEHLGLDLAEILARSRAVAAGAGEVTRIPVAGGAGSGLRLVLLVGLGDESPAAFRRAGAGVARATQDLDAVATTIASTGGNAGLTAFVEGAMLGSFGFHWRSTGPEHTPVGRVVLAGLTDGPDQAEALERGLHLGGAGWRARMLATVPSNLKSPQWLADQAQTLAADHGLTYRVWDERELEKDGFGGIVAVGRASATPPRLIRLDYVPGSSAASKRAPLVVLVGKGITFDTGGLSMKTGEGMATMKRDMTGGAVVMAVMAALSSLGCPLRVTGLIPAAENAIGGDSLRPGDVVVHYGGRTTEVLNTDAEGRLVLADAMAYAVAELRPAVLVDVATLTGAMKVALGQRVGGYFANDDALAARLFAAGEESGEALWRMPLEDDYEDALRSQVADCINNPGGPGAITAALFLQHFAGDVPWAHLDLASVGDSPSELFEWTSGPSGFGPRALLHWLTGSDPLRAIS